MTDEIDHLQPLWGTPLLNIEIATTHGKFAGVNVSMLRGNTDSLLSHDEMCQLILSYFRYAKKHDLPITIPS